MALSQTKTLKNSNKIQETEFQCEFCKKSFQRETSLMNHACETKRRWQNKDLAANRIGFQSWQEFYVKNTAAKKPRTYLDFIDSSYYTVFVKFGNYCIDIKAINVLHFANWLMKNKVRIDNWASDTNYNKFLIEHLKDEDPLDAVARSIESTIELAKDAEIQTCDCLRYANRNKLVQAIVNGKISPWMLYHSESGIALLEDLDESQQKMIMDYIHPEKWAIKFKRDPDVVLRIKQLLKAGGY